MKDILIGIDAGTSVIKSIAFDLGGRQIAAYAIPNKYDMFEGAGATQNLARTWADCAATLRGLAEKVPDLAKRTAALAVTGQGDGTWLIDKSGAPVGDGWLWLDARAASIVDEIRAGPNDRARFEKTGSGLAACQQGPQLIFMKEHMPEAVQKAAHGFHCKDWLYFNLTGEIATDPTEGVFTFGDFRTRNYDEGVIETLGLTDQRHLLPGIVDGVSVSHPLHEAGAKLTGLLAGTPVVLGYVDVACTALGAGLFDKKALPGCTVIGSTGMHMRLAATQDDVKLNEDRTGYTMCMPAPGVYAQMQSNMAATLNIDWILSLAAGVLAGEGVKKSHGDMLGLVDGWVASAKPGGLLYQPYISEAGERGPFIDADARAGFIGLSMRHGFGDMVRAVVEGLALSARDCYLASGSVPKEVRLTGGAARSRSLRQILAAALGADVRTSSREEAGAAGAAMIAAVSIGLYQSMEECAAEWVTPLLGEAEKPDAALSQTYASLYPAYAGAHQALRPVWKNLAAARSAAQ
jgi:erythritol kinase (D-erythritol 1-phosphate-forming)